MAKKIRITISFEHQEYSETLDREYTVYEEVVIVDDYDNHSTMNHVAMYMAGHAKHFKGYMTEVFDDTEEKS